MLKRTIYLTSPLKVSVRYGQLILTPTDGNDTVARSVPIEDLAHVIIDNQRVIMTMPAINELGRHNVGVIICDERSQPHIMLNPLDSNTLQGQRYRTQLEATLPAKKSIWQQIVTAKIRNQSELLDKIGKDGNRLKPYYKNVKSGDSDNREGIAAKIYWTELFGTGFSRSRDGLPPNNLLNYGYSILRAATARAIVGTGLLPAIGLHHCNRSNAFPLADDFMEPFRPFVDYAVCQLLHSGASQLNKESKTALINVMYCDTAVNAKTHPLSIALNMLCTSALKIMDGEGKVLNVPSFAKNES